MGALALHLPGLAPLARGRRLATVYIGGGTPSMWPPGQLARVLELVDASIGIAPGAEITIEANPATLSRAKLKALISAGFNRLSIGAQSMNPAYLRLLGRAHSPEDVRKGVEWARSAGWENVSLDLIYALPYQGLKELAQDIKALVELGPEHISAYELTLNPASVFGRRYRRGCWPMPPQESLEQMYELVVERLEASGYKRYEVSNFALPGLACRHNQGTWAGGDYLPLGPGAHGHLEGMRWAWVADVGEYAARVAAGGDPAAWRERLSPRQRALELIMLGLRTTVGVDMARVGELLGVNPFSFYAAAIAEIEARGWARVEGHRLVPTHQGIAMADAAAALFA